jgi:large subunit ribosomal protein L30
MAIQLKVTQVKSAIGRPAAQRVVLKGLGLRRLHDSRLVPDNEASRGAIFKVQHLVKVEPVTASARS